MSDQGPIVVAQLPGEDHLHLELHRHYNTPLHVQEVPCGDPDGYPCPSCIDYGLLGGSFLSEHL